MERYDLTGRHGRGAIGFTAESEKYPEGREYVFKSPPGREGLFLVNLIQLGQKAALGDAPSAQELEKLLVDDDDERDMYHRVMGDTLEVMLDDGVNWEDVQNIYTSLLRKWGQFQPIRSTLEELDAGEAEGPAANRAEKRAAAKKSPAKKAPARSSSRKGGSRSSRTSGATKALTADPASTPSSETSEPPVVAATA
jgi:hypothetical protein